MGRPKKIILSKQAKIRLTWMEYYQKCKNARMTCRHFGISPDTFYLWKRRFNPSDLSTLEDKKTPTSSPYAKKQLWSPETIGIIIELKSKFPSMGKEKISLYLQDRNISVSSATIGRILRSLRENNYL